MSRFLSEKLNKLVPYTPGEQPRDMKYIKLNTNESPFMPSETARKYAQNAANSLELYPDPECKTLSKLFAETVGVPTECVLATNGSDEILNFAFMAFCDENHPAIFPDITYGFYSVFANLHSSDFTVIPLEDDFSIDANKFCGVNGCVFIANPNAPTGLALSLSDVEKIVKSNPENVVVIDEAYVDFGAESAVNLVNKYDNLLVVQTFSKSRSMAGARLGFAIGNEEIIGDLHKLRYSTNPYNINRLTLAAGSATIDSQEYYDNNCKKIMETREYVKAELEKLGFFVLPSKANFIFASSDNIDGGELYLKLKEKGVLIRHFTTERIRNFNRITIGTPEEMKIFIDKVKEIMEEN